MKWVFGFVSGFLVMGILAGCQNGSQDRFPKIRYGKDVCAECHMIISEERFAAVLASGSGQNFKFDGIGCLRKYITDNPAEKGKVWVHDFESGKWINAKEAFFVYDKEMQTPMGDGIAAFQNRAAAESWAGKVKGNVITFDELLEKQLKGGIVS